MSMPGVGASESELRERLTAILCATPSLMRVLSVARHLCLPDWLVFSGAVYQPVLNHLTGRPLDYGIKDYDLGYFDASDLSYDAEDAIIRRVKAVFKEPLRSMVEVRNQARVHLWFEAKFGEVYGPLSCTAEASQGDGEACGNAIEMGGAVLAMIDLLVERGWNRQQAYAICSVAVDLKLSELVDVPNMVVSAFLPLDIFGQ